MRSIKVIFLLAAVSLFVSVPFDVQAKDCSAYKKLSHKWLMCKGGSDKYDASVWNLSTMSLLQYLSFASGCV